MADTKPLKIAAGQVQQFQSGDNVPWTASAFAGVSSPAGPLGSSPNFDPGGAGWLRLDVSDGAAFTGFVAGVAGQPLRVTSTSGLLQLVPNHTDSSVGNRLRHPRSYRISLAQWESAEYVYDAVAGVWLLVSNHVPTGSIISEGHNPLSLVGFLPCDGAAVSRAVYGALFDTVGTTWGAGNGTSTFNVPDLRGRVSVGAGTGTGLTARTIGGTGGEETHVLSVAEMPAHSHNAQFDTAGTAGANQRRPVSWSGAANNVATQSQGGDGAHNNMQPWGCTSFWIRV